MSAVFTALATSVNGYITGPDPSPISRSAEAAAGVAAARIRRRRWSCCRTARPRPTRSVRRSWPLASPTPSRRHAATLHLRSVVPAPGVTHLHYDVQK